MRPRGPRPDALQSVAVLEILAALDPQHGEAGVPFKDLEATARSRLNYRALTDQLSRRNCQMFSTGFNSGARAGSSTSVRLSGTTRSLARCHRPGPSA